MRVTLDEVGHRFGAGPWLFRDVTAWLPAGSSTALLGPSGSGKSTLLLLLAGWLTPGQGSITRAGVTRLGWVFQQPFGVPGRSALDHVTLPILAAGATRRAADRLGRDVLDRFLLGHVADRAYATLSGGEAQRLMLARATAGPADLLLVDEPTAQLDPVSARAVREVVAALTTPDRVVVIATHDPLLAEQCDRRIELGERTDPVRAAR